MLAQLLTMLDLQEKINIRTDGICWRSEDRDYDLAALVETGELICHNGYKWWKEETCDIPQVQLEVVDIWHFLLSDFLKKETDHKFIASNLHRNISSFVYDDLSVIDSSKALMKVILCEELYSHRMDAFLNLMHSSGLTFESLYYQYVNKNVLNFFRQDHGYKNKTYIKIWDGREDNEHLVEISKKLDPFLDNYSQVLYEKLEEKYLDVVEKMKIV